MPTPRFRRPVDLDGTLLDTLADLAAACNAALRSMAVPSSVKKQSRPTSAMALANWLNRLCEPAARLGQMKKSNRSTGPTVKSMAVTGM